MNAQPPSHALERFDRGFKQVNAAIIVAMLAAMVALVFGKDDDHIGC